jgi:hypothetical protein
MYFSNKKKHVFSIYKNNLSIKSEMCGVQRQHIKNNCSILNLNENKKRSKS